MQLRSLAMQSGTAAKIRGKFAASSGFSQITVCHTGTFLRT